MRVFIHSIAIVAILACIAQGQETPQQKMQQITDKGLEFLKTQQKPDGGWQSGQRDLPGVTGLVVRAFVCDPRYPADTDFVKRGIDRLIAQQQPDGGVYNGSVANYNTAIAVSTFAVTKKPQYQPNIDKALAFLKGKQWNDSDSIDANSSFNGGWGYANQGQDKGRPDLSNSHMVLDALHDAGLKPTDPAFQAALKFVTRMQNHSETNDLAWAGNDGGFIYSLGPNGAGQSTAGTYNSPDGKPMHRSYGSMTYAGLKSFIGDARWMENNPSLATAYVVLALQEVQKDLAEHPAAGK